MVRGRLPPALTSPLQICHLLPPPSHPRDHPPPQPPTPGVASQTSKVLAVAVGCGGGGCGKRRLVSSSHLTTSISLSRTGGDCHMQNRNFSISPTDKQVGLRGEAAYKQEVRLCYEKTVCVTGTFRKLLPVGKRRAWSCIQLLKQPEISSVRPH